MASLGQIMKFAAFGQIRLLRALFRERQAQ
jgi:hypothetical protein